MHQLCPEITYSHTRLLLFVCPTQANNAESMSSSTVPQRVAVVLPPEHVLTYGPRGLNDLVYSHAASNTGGSNGATMRCLISLLKAGAAAPSLFPVLNLL